MWYRLGGDLGPSFANQTKHHAFLPEATLEAHLPLAKLEQRPQVKHEGAIWKPACDWLNRKPASRILPSDTPPGDKNVCVVCFSRLQFLNAM